MNFHGFEAHPLDCDCKKVSDYYNLNSFIVLFSVIFMRLVRQLDPRATVNLMDLFAMFTNIG